MTDLFAARSQMAMSLAFHIVFAAIGIGLPLLMVLSEWMWLRRRDEVWLRLTKTWAKGLSIFFAVGAVSGTVLSFELGLLWPEFMAVAGPLVGVPFSLEGLAFFTEAIFLGIYLYGWDRVGPRAHWWAGVAVAVSGAASALFVLSVNGWMNAPTGYVPAGDGAPARIDPLAAMANPYWIGNTVHMLLAAYAATGFGAASIHAWRLLRDPTDRFHRKALELALALGAVAALLQPVSGDAVARLVAEQQPAKLAALEAHFETGPCAPLRIGGWPDEEAEVTRWSLEIPCGLSLLVGRSPGTVVTGLSDIPRAERPPVAPVHFAFQGMVAIGFYLAALGAWAGWSRFRRRPLADQRLLLRLLVPAGPLAFLAIELGWVVTEVGRQPWIIHGILRTEDAVTPMPGLVVPFAAFTLLYLLLAAVVVYLMRRQVLASARTGTGGTAGVGRTGAGPGGRR